MDPYIEYLEAKQLKPYLVAPTGRMPIDFADELKTADHYIGSWLVAKMPVKVYSSPGGVLTKAYSFGQNVGQIRSYVLKNGVVWWELKDGGFVEHAKGKFDTKIAENSASGVEHQQLMEDLNTQQNDPLSVLTSSGSSLLGGVNKTLSFVGDNLKFLVIGLVLIILASAYFKLKTI